MFTLARILAPVLVAALAGPVAAGAAASNVGPVAPAPYRVPVPVERSLPNGLRIAVFVDHRLPVVQMEMLIPAGAAQEPEDAPGVAGAVAQLLRAGTSSRSAETLANDLDRLGAALASSAARDFSVVAATFRAADLDAGMELLADVVVHPLFPPREVDRFRGQLAIQLQHAQQNPATLADSRLWALAFRGHPYGRNPLGSLSALDRVNGDAVRAFHRDFYRPDRAVLVIAGDVDPDRAFAAAADRFGSWAGRAAVVPAGSVPTPVPGPRIYVVDRPELARSEVRAAFLCPPRTDPDALALQIANSVLVGGGASSRLAVSLGADGLPAADMRSAYTILKDAGLASLGGAVVNDSVAGFVTRLRDEVVRLTRQPPDEAEVAAARRTFADGFPLQFQTPSALMTQWLGADCYGLGAGWLDRYADEIATVTPERVADAAARWLDVARMIVVVVGPAASLAPALGTLGPVETVGVEEAPAVAAPAMPPPSREQRERGRRLLDGALTAHGGLARLRRVKDSTVEGTITTSLGGNEIELALQVMRKEPGLMRYITRMGKLENGQVLRGDRGWVYMGADDSLTVGELDSLGVAAMQTAFRSDIVHVLLAAADPSAQLAARGPDRADGHDVEVLEVSLPRVGPGARAERILLHLDVTSRRVVAMDLGEDPLRAGVFHARRIYREHRPVSGVLWPFYEESRLDGTTAMVVRLNSVVLDSGLEDARFERPAIPGRIGPLR